jgi:hypothetical protein
MENKIQLKHPAGKKAISMDNGKYDTLKKLILNQLKTKGESTHGEILRAITLDIKKNRIKFEGSVEWYMEWVKLDLEARGEIKRTNSTSPITFEMVK